jgi:hypothetical protein
MCIMKLMLESTSASIVLCDSDSIAMRSAEASAPQLWLSAAVG